MNGPSAARHVSVLPREVIELLAPAPGQGIVDATLGAGGHARLIAERIAPTGRLIGLDCDPAMRELAQTRLADLPVTLVDANFDQLREVLNRLHVERVNALLADL